jgi:hypothetical protein
MHPPVALLRFDVARLGSLIARLPPFTARWVVLLSLCGVLLEVSVTEVVRAPVTSAAAAPPAFPRVATLYSKTGMSTDQVKRSIARFDLYVTSFGWWPHTCESDSACNGNAGRTVGQYLKTLNPNLQALMYMHANGYEDGSWSTTRQPPGQGFDFSTGGTVNYIDPRWFLTYVGSSLTANVSADATVLRVSDLSRYGVNDRLMVGGRPGESAPEMMLITAKSAATGPGTLTVVRGRNSQGGVFPAVAHRKGDLVKTVAYALNDQGFLMMNTTATCPSTSINRRLGPQTWNQFLTWFLKTKLTEPEFTNLDGIFLDNFIQYPISYFNRYQELDIDNDNVAETRSAGEDLYSQGMQQLASLTRQSFPNQIVSSNTGGDAERQSAYFNGGMIEGVDEQGFNWFVNWRTGDPRPFYDGWIQQGRQPATFIYEGAPRGWSAAQIQGNYTSMRFLLSSALMNNGYFVYDEFGYGGHQTAWWYDEFDNAGARHGYLGQPLGPGTQVQPNIWRRDFDNGIVLANSGNAPVTVSLGGTYKRILASGTCPDGSGTCAAPQTVANTGNDGASVTSLALGAYDGRILLSATGSSGTTYRYSWEDATVQGWQAGGALVNGQPVASVSNSGAQASDGTRSLQVSMSNAQAPLSRSNWAWAYVREPPGLLPGGTITLQVYATSPGLSASIAVQVQGAPASWNESAATPLTANAWTQLTYRLPDAVTLASPWYLGVRFFPTAADPATWSGTAYVDAVRI